MSLRTREALLTFLWWPDDNLEMEPVEYQMCVHLLQYHLPVCQVMLCNRKAVTDNIDSYGVDTVKAVLKNFYVDDINFYIDDPDKRNKRIFHGLV